MMDDTNDTNDDRARWAAARMMDEDERAEILAGIARTLTVLRCADIVEDEDARESMGLTAGTALGDALDECDPGAGGDWMDSVPDGSMAGALRVARTVCDSWASLNEGRTIEADGARWVALSGDDLERFAHCVAMESAGTGVGLSDDLPTGAEAWASSPIAGEPKFLAWRDGMRRPTVPGDCEHWGFYCVGDDELRAFLDVDEDEGSQ